MWPFRRSTIPPTTPPQQTQRDLLAIVREAISAQAQRDMDEDTAGWARMGAGDGYEMDAGALKGAREKCRRLWANDPVVARACNLLAWGAIGRGLDSPNVVGMTDPGKPDPRIAKAQEVIDRCWFDRDNQRAMFSRAAMIRANARLVTDGALAYTVHTSEADPSVKVALVPTAEVCDVISAPEDRYRPVAYLRERGRRTYDVAQKMWTDTGQAEALWYPDIEEWWQPEEQWDPDVIDLWRSMGVEGRHPACLLYVPVNTLGLVGVPEAYRAYDWAVAHAIAVSSGVTLAKALGMLAWDQKVDTKSQAALSNAAGLFADPAAGTGSAFTHTGNVSLSPVNAPSGGVQNFESAGRQAMLETTRSIGGFGEHWFGDPSTGNLATAAAMELPAVWAIEDRQELFGDTFRRIIDVALARAAAAGEIPNEPVPYTIDFPSANPRHQPTTALLLGAIGLAAEGGHILGREASRQMYYLLESENIPALLDEQYGDGAQEKPEEQPTEQPEGVAEAAGDRPPFHARAERSAGGVGVGVRRGTRSIRYQALARRHP